jgi:hypothetical protein
MDAVGDLHGPELRGSVTRDEPAERAEIGAAESLTRIAKHKLPHVCTPCKIIGTVIDSDQNTRGIKDAEHLGVETGFLWRGLYFSSLLEENPMWPFINGPTAYEHTNEGYRQRPWGIPDHHFQGSEKSS